MVEPYYGLRVVESTITSLNTIDSIVHPLWIELRVPDPETMDGSGDCILSVAVILAD